MPAKARLTASDICVIIEACFKSRVSRFAYGDIKIDFDTATSEWRNAYPVAVDQPEGGETPSGGSDRVSPTAPSQLVMSDEDKALMEEARLAQLMTDNPMAYEQEMIDANLYPRGSDGSGKDDR